MSNAVETDILTLIEKELSAANEKYPLFASPHEAYAVILEEVEEADIAIKSVDRFIAAFWAAVKANEDRITLTTFSKCAYEEAISLAIEAVQVAAMCRKFEMSLPREEKAK